MADTDDKLDLMIYKQLLFELGIMRESLAELANIEYDTLNKLKNKIQCSKQKFYNIVSNLQ
jgi:predicted transcriptional regulator